MLDPRCTKISYKLYRKALNNYERVPFASHHPLDVKRGTFIGELSRLAALSSTRAYYEQAVSDVRMIYLSRGYPDTLLKSWIGKFVDRQWERRHDPTREAEPVSGVLKTVFNPVWEHLDIHVIQEAINEKWFPFWISELENTKGTKRASRAETSRNSGPVNRQVKRRRTNLGLADSTLVAHMSSDEENSDDDPDVADDVTAVINPHLPPTDELMASIFNLINGRMLVSRKRSHTLGNLVSMYRSDLLGTKDALDELVLKLRPDILEKWM